MKGKQKPIYLTPAEKAHAKAIWTAMLQGRKSVLEVPGFSRSLKSLAVQGYTLHDIGVMFGVSRERVRQWFSKLGVRATSLHDGNICRMWDERFSRFVSVPGRVARNSRRRPCACGCGGSSKGKWLQGHQPHVVSIETREKLSRSAKAAWARLTPNERRRRGKTVSDGWKRYVTK